MGADTKYYLELEKSSLIVLLEFAQVSKKKNHPVDFNYLLGL